MEKSPSPSGLVLALARAPAENQNAPWLRHSLPTRWRVALHTLIPLHHLLTPHSCGFRLYLYNRQSCARLLVFSTKVSSRLL